MRKFRHYLAFVFTVPAALLILLVIILVALAGLVAGYGYNRPFQVLSEELNDAFRYVRLRLELGRHK